MFAALVIFGIVLPVLCQAIGNLLLESSDIFGLWIPIYIERLDLCAQKVIRTARAKLRQARGILRIDIAEDLLIVLNRSNEAFLL